MLVEVTYACKMGCTHCLSDCKPDGEHMTLEVFEDVLKFMIKNQIPTWSFSGGEMFEHPDILKMLSLIESYWKTLPIKYPITFATNGRELVRNKKIKKMEDVVTIPMTKYVTTDGKEFADDYDANMHQAHLDSMAEAKLCFEKYGIYTSDLMIKNHKNNDQIISNDYLLTRVLHTDISSNDDLYILQAKDEEAEKEILKTFRDYLNTDVMDRRFFNVANNYIFPHTIIFCRDSIYGNYNALCAEREFELIEKALKFGRQVLNMADKKEDNIVSDEAKEKNMINKRELAARLKQGECLEEIFDFTDGQECLIYKGEFEVSDNIIYIPDIYLNKLNLGVVETGENLNDILKNCYTGNDFLKECNGYKNIAKALFDFVDWQHPNIQDLTDCYDEEEFYNEFGIHFDDLGND